ncbi:uncharacterized protein N7477_005549 [Penicillium maclennaniae]|uniref:uncharacterized protein n=1 Tax=Penicillium maclennaniae TaxID=1343394 RepID=UPI00253F7E20|nr:uncharacterized protein N7477_005549 [Penicillium maclennaniae]KAJ5670186.1 hypothetical protein N7477_005549 [Penicillium maclennaniae]
MSLVAIATSSFTAAASSPSPSSSPLHMLYYHEASAAGQDPGGDGNVYKRWRERPQRPIKVWAFDVSKQVFGSVLLHMANLLMSMFSAGQLEIKTTYRPNPCSFYLLNLGIDTTLGIPILIIILRVLNFLASYTILANPPESIESGNYGQPPRATWWLKQSIIYFMGLFSMKFCVFFLIQLLPFIIKIGDWALRWTEGNTALQIAFVMLLFPLIMNAIQYYIIDGFIKKPLSYDLYTSGDTDDDPDDIHRREALLAGLDEAYSSTDSGDEESAPGKDISSQPKDVANALHGSEELLTEDHSPVPPYEPPSSGSSRSEQGGKRNAEA